MLTIAIYHDEDGNRRFVVHEHDEDDNTAVDVTDAYQVLECPCEDGNGDGLFIRQLSGEQGLLDRVRGFGADV